MAVHILQHILLTTEHLSLFLHGTECVLIEASKERKAIVEMLRRERQDDLV